MTPPPGRLLLLGLVLAAGAFLLVLATRTFLLVLAAGAVLLLVLAAGAVLLGLLVLAAAGALAAGAVLGLVRLGLLPGLAVFLGVLRPAIACLGQGGLGAEGLDRRGPHGGGATGHERTGGEQGGDANQLRDHESSVRPEPQLGPHGGPVDETGRGLPGWVRSEPMCC